MKNIDNIVTILHKENNHEKINKLEEIEILKEAASMNILNDVISGRKESTLQTITLKNSYFIVHFSSFCVVFKF